jgi:cytochrome c peroxidase
MKPTTLVFCSIAIMAEGACSGTIQREDPGPTAEALSSGSFPDDFGRVRVFSTTGAIDRANPFFKSLGANGRTCNSCHKLQDALGISVATIQRIFDDTDGLDPLFRINDGSNAPTGYYANTSTRSARETSFSMLLNHGTIRVGIGMPESADFALLQAQDPFYFASASELSLFRRPLPSVNVAFDAHVMWDGRESEGRPAIRDALKNQANDATQGHAERPTPLDDTTRAAIADFQLNLFAAQSKGALAGALDVPGCEVNDDGEECEPARGGPVNLAAVLTEPNPGSEEQGGFPPFFIGINDSFASGFKNISFTIFEPWESADLPKNDTSAITKARGEIGDGENIFYTKPIEIVGVAGLNDVLGQPVVHGFCTTCHNTPDVGNHSRPRFFNIGTSSPYLGDNPLAGNIIEFPKYTFQKRSGGAYVVSTDPGLALRTGKFADIGKFKVPILRGLGARAPYFHNGQAQTLTDVVNFYNQRFKIGFTDEEIRKVVLFLEQT